MCSSNLQSNQKEECMFANTILEYSLLTILSTVKRSFELLIEANLKIQIRDLFFAQIRIIF